MNFIAPILAYLGKELVRKILLWTAAAALLAAVYVLVDNAVVALTSWIAGQSDPIVDGAVMPLFSMMAFMGLFEGWGIIIGAHLVVLSIKYGCLIFGWTK